MNNLSCTRVSPKSLWTWKEDLSPSRLEKLGPKRLSIAWVGPPARGVCLAFLLPLIALMRSLPGNATCELKLDLGHGRRRLVGVSVNCHI